VIKSYQTAQLLAQELLLQAQKNEPNITADLQNIAEKVTAEMVGLERKFKTEESLTRKLAETAEVSSEKIERVAESVNDALRYTFVLPFEIYAESFQKAIEILINSDYQVPKKRIWNAWKNIGRSRDKGYRGINITVISSQNQKFELQFHTAESFALKTETHNLYKELRSKMVSEKRETELITEMKKAAWRVSKPEGI
jgi:hypothetical protein